jgi:hypothetical protein
MVDVNALISLCATALRAAPDVLRKLRNARLSPEESDLLSGAADSGEFHVLDIALCSYPLIRAGGRDFASPEDPAQCARYQGAFERLCERGYIQHQSGILFTLTPAGFDQARKLMGLPV